MKDEIIKIERSIIPACDVPLDLYEKILKETKDIEKIGGYKIGFFLALKYGLPKIVELTRKYTNKPIIYDHQKAGTDIPSMGEKFVKICKNSGIDAIIIFPQAGPETERTWIEYAKENDLGIIVGGLMTHEKYRKSEGGFLDDEGIFEIYRIAADLGIRNFVVPGNKLEEIKKIKEILEERGITPIFYAPGFVTQGGEITETAKVAGRYWHAIVGRGIYKAKDIKKAALEYASML